MPLADYRAEFGLRELPFYDLYGSFLNAVRTLAPKAMRPMTRSNTVRADELSVQMIYHRKPHEQLLHSGWLPNEVEYALRNGASAGPEPTLGSGMRGLSVFGGKTTATHAHARQGQAVLR